MPEMRSDVCRHGRVPCAHRRRGVKINACTIFDFESRDVVHVFPILQTKLLAEIDISCLVVHLAVCHMMIIVVIEAATCTLTN